MHLGTVHVALHAQDSCQGAMNVAMSAVHVACFYEDLSRAKCLLSSRVFGASNAVSKNVPSKLS